MNIYTVVILNTDARTLDSERLETMTFKTFDSAVEYVSDFLVDEGLVEMDEIKGIRLDLMDDHVFTIGHFEFYISSSRLNEW